MRGAATRERALFILGRWGLVPRKHSDQAARAPGRGAFVDDGAFRDLVREHAATRQGDEGAEGVASFREKRAARWYPGPA